MEQDQVDGGEGRVDVRWAAPTGTRPALVDIGAILSPSKLSDSFTAEGLAAQPGRVPPGSLWR